MKLFPNRLRIISGLENKLLLLTQKFRFLVDYAILFIADSRNLYKLNISFSLSNNQRE